MNDLAKVDFDKFSNDQIDQVMSQIGMRLANEIVGKSLEDDDIDDILVSALEKASEKQRYEVADNMIDLLSVSKLVRTALSDDGKLDEEEVNELVEYLNELEDDTKAVIKDLVK